jgi:hypothetical protein
MTLAEKKEANKLFWMVKGQLIPDDWSDVQIEQTRTAYFDRLWGNHETCYREDGFEEAWNNKMMLLG